MFIKFEQKELEILHTNIGKNVKRLREAKGLTQLQLSHAIGHKGTSIISQAELGKKKHFNIEQLYKISKALEVEMGEFFQKLS